MSDILIDRQGTLARIRLNRPKAINALNLEMVHAIAAALDQFALDPAVGAVMMTGEGELGLCAGGDIRALYEFGRDGSDFGQRFFRDEYRMNLQIDSYNKPYIAIMDGITMGGVVGVSAHGEIRIVTERTRMAMPETGIGLFPDVGDTWLLAKTPGEFGTFIGLSGHPTGGEEAIFAGLADYFVKTERLHALIEAFASIPISASRADLRTVIGLFAEETALPLESHRAEIDSFFAFDSVEEILGALDAGTSEFAQKTACILRMKSPTSLKVTLRLLRLARQSGSLRECLERSISPPKPFWLRTSFTKACVRPLSISTVIRNGIRNRLPR